MTPEAAIHIVSQTFWTTCWICAPLLLLAFIVGLVINIVQIATSLQDPTFSTIPRLATFLAGFLLLMPWMLKQLSAYTVSILGNLAHYAR